MSHFIKVHNVYNKSNPSCWVNAEHILLIKRPEDVESLEKPDAKAVIYSISALYSEMLFVKESPEELMNML